MSEPSLKPCPVAQVWPGSVVSAKSITPLVDISTLPDFSYLYAAPPAQADPITQDLWQLRDQSGYMVERLGEGRAACDLAYMDLTTTYRHLAHDLVWAERHVQFHIDFERVVARSATPAAATPTPAQADAADAMRLVPLAFLQGVLTLAHNYSLNAVAPDYYHGVECDAFADAYRRCGQALAKLRAMVVTPPAQEAGTPPGGAA